MPGRRVLLIKPHQNLATNYHSPPLGLLYLAAYLRRRGDVDVRIVDMPVAGVAYEQLGQRIRDFRPDWVGISALTFEAKGLHRAAAIAKQAADVPVVAGGPHATCYTREVLADRHVDFAVLGEGEITADRLWGVLDGLGRAGDVQGLAWRDGAAVVTNGRGAPVDDPDTLPFPAWDLVDVASYARYDRMSRIGRRAYMSLFTSRACPFQCLHCLDMFGKGFRARSPENVLSEMRALHDEHGVREFEIVDDCFNLDVARAGRIFELIIESGLEVSITFPNGLRADRLDDDLLAKARRAGVVFMSFGVETASPRLQKLLCKNLDLEEVSRGIAMARRHGIMTLGFFMLGFPTETREEMQLTVDYAVRSPLHAANFFAVTPYDGTGLADLARKMGKPVCTDFDQAYLGDKFTNLTDLPDGEVRRIRRQAILRFYASPSRVWSIVRDYPDKLRLPHLAGVLLRRLMLRF